MDILCVVDTATREVTVVDNVIIAAFDHNVDVAHIVIEPIEGFALNTSTIRIAALSPTNTRHDYNIDPATVEIDEETGSISFDWPIPQSATEMPLGVYRPGDTATLDFAICAEIRTGSSLSQAWHSANGEITVVAHLEPEE